MLTTAYDSVTIRDPQQGTIVLLFGTPLPYAGRDCQNAQRSFFHVVRKHLEVHGQLFTELARR